MEVPSRYTLLFKCLFCISIWIIDFQWMVAGDSLSDRYRRILQKVFLPSEIVRTIKITGN